MPRRRASTLLAALLALLGVVSAAPVPAAATQATPARSALAAGVDVNSSPPPAPPVAKDTSEARNASGSPIWLQRDPAGYEDSVNLYAGFANNPVNYRDPTGAQAYFDTGMDPNFEG